MRIFNTFLAKELYRERNTFKQELPQLCGNVILPVPKAVTGCALVISFTSLLLKRESISTIIEMKLEICIDDFQLFIAYLK